MACSYLMSTDDIFPVVEKKETEEWSQVEAFISSMPTDDPSIPLTQKAYESSHTTEGDPTSSDKDEERKPAPELLAHVLELHSSKRMKAPSPGEQGKQGVSIPSQRRWLHYWSLLLSHRAPPDFWTDKPHPKVRITSITLWMKEFSAIKYQLVRASNLILNSTSKKGHTGKGEVWVSLARYDDGLVNLLEKWELHTRDEGGQMGLRKPGSSDTDDAKLADIFKTTKWDEKKMVRAFARMGIEGGAPKEEIKEQGKVITYVMKPLTDEKWVKIKEATIGDGEELENQEVKSETTSVDEVATKVFMDGQGIIVDANRELRAKLYTGQVSPFFFTIP